ncbi:MAG: RNA 2'-phosphotransferase, partial [Planctomycetota bacterium]|nr:RNA 2'-phosphotransferase [Planctomycetota bacterium]
MTHPALIERITRSLAYMLRHQPEEFDLTVDEFGYAEVDDVVRALNERLGEPVDEMDVRDAVLGGDRQRYEIEGTKIRALYGHSIEVQPGQPSEPPAELFVGVSSGDADRARRHGLRAGRRRFLHLALSPEDAIESGRRAAHDYVVITVRAGDAWEAGINFYDRRSLFLSDPIPTEFLDVGEVHTDGFGEVLRERGGRGDDRGGRREERGGGQRGQGHGRGGGGGGRSHAAPRVEEHVHDEEVHAHADQPDAEHEVEVGREGAEQHGHEAPAFGEGGEQPTQDRGAGGNRRRGRGRGRGAGPAPAGGPPRHDRPAHAAPRSEVQRGEAQRVEFQHGEGQHGERQHGERQ